LQTRASTVRGIAVGSVAASVPDEVHGHRRDAFGDGVNGLRRDWHPLTQTPPVCSRALPGPTGCGSTSSSFSASPRLKLRQRLNSCAFFPITRMMRMHKNSTTSSHPWPWVHLVSYAFCTFFSSDKHALSTPWRG
jgi:hypothetical protein